MNAERKAATKIKDVAGFHGDAALFKLTPPLDDGTEFVIASAVDVPSISHIFPGYRTSETMVFKADGEDVADWCEIGFVPYKSHADALADMGYEVAS